MLDPVATMLYEKFERRKATSRITNAIAAMPASEYIARRPESTHALPPPRAPYSDAPSP